jgi:hypothetical protein
LLFDAGEKGVWFDPSRTSTLFQDANGMVALTAPGQPVGLASDLSGNALHATQSAQARPIYGRVPSTGQRNLSPLSEPTIAQLNTSTGIADAALGLPDFDGTLQFPGGTVGNRIGYRDHGVEPNTEYTISCFVRMDDGAAPVPGTDFALVISNNGDSVNFATPVEVAPGLWRVARTATSLSTGPRNTGLLKVDTHSARGFRVSGFQVEAGASLTAYQRARSHFDITETGQRDCYYLYFGGTDDPRWMTTPGIGLTHTSQTSIVIGVEKLSDNLNAGVLVNFIDTGFQRFAFEIPQAGGGDTRFFHAGKSSAGDVKTSLNLNQPVLYSGLSDLDAPLIALRENGVQVGQSSAATGGGPYRNGPLHFSSGAGSHRRFHGRLFGFLLIDRILSATEISMVEKYMARRAGVTL